MINDKCTSQYLEQAEKALAVVSRLCGELEK